MIFQLAERVLTCVENNTLAIEPIPGDTPYTGWETRAWLKQAEFQIVTAML